MRKLQVALDRIDFNTFQEMYTLLKNDVDILEIGTSILREYGLRPLDILKYDTSTPLILADAKIMDNIKYELELYFIGGADIVTISWITPIESIEISSKIAKKYNKEIMIDLLNIDEYRLKNLIKYEYDNIIYCYHIGFDQQANNITIDKDFIKLLENKRLAIAGGININNIDEYLKLVNPEIVIAGSYITNSENPLENIKKLRKKLNE